MHLQRTFPPRPLPRACKWLLFTRGGFFLILSKIKETVSFCDSQLITALLNTTNSFNEAEIDMSRGSSGGIDSPEPLCLHQRVRRHLDALRPGVAHLALEPARNVALFSWPKHMPHQPAAPKPTMTSSYPASDAWSTARRIAFELVIWPGS